MLIYGQGSDGNVVAGDWIGTTASGDTSLPNGTSPYFSPSFGAIGGGVVIEAGASGNRIGSDGLSGDSGEANDISGNDNDGIDIWGSGTSLNVVAGNLIGTDPTGTLALGNERAGACLEGGATANTIGGTSSGSGNVLSGNIVGVLIYSTGTSGNVIAGNEIGTDVTGSVAIGNTYEGVDVASGATGNIIGGSTQGAGNVISGNTDDGVVLLFASSTLLEGNRIGTDSSGTKVLGNGEVGVELESGANTTIGGTAAGAGNLISGNFQAAIFILGFTSGPEGNVVQGNFIGTDATGTKPLSNSEGIFIEYSDGNTIGGTAAGAGNIIAASLATAYTSPYGLSGIGLYESSGNLVQGNFIGTNPSGSSSLGNGSNGIVLTYSTGNTIGGTATGAGNILAFNNGDGISVGESAADSSTGNSILENSIYSDGTLGIDLGDDGVTLDDSSGHTGPNLFQDFPVLTSALTTDGATTITGSLSGSPDTTYRIEFFSNPVADPSGYGQGETYLTFVNATTNSSGTASFSVQTLSAVAVGQFISATATDPLGNTSEFSKDLVNSALTISSIAAISPNPRNSPVSTVSITLNELASSAGFGDQALTLTDDGGPNLITSAVTVTPTSATTYQISGLAGLTTAQGLYTLTVNAGDIQDQNGIPGSGTLSILWLMDTTPPTSHVNALPSRGTSLSFPVSVTGVDPTAGNGGPASGVASYAIYISINGGPWSLWTTVPASNPTATFPGQSNTTYSFYSIATDLAGNVEIKAPLIEASTYLPDLTPPVTSVNATTGTNPSTVNSTTGTFTLDLTGNDPGGAALTYFEVFVSIDGGTYQEVGPYAIPAGEADSQGNYHSSIAYQGLTDDHPHTYAFYSIGLDAASNLQVAPKSPNVTLANQVFSTPSQLQVSSFTVEHGSPSRSFIRYLDLGFNESDAQSGSELTTIVNSIGTASPDITIYKYDLNGDASSKTAVPLSSPTMLSVIDHAIEIDFGSGGIGNSPTTTTPDGYYEVDIKLPDGQTAVHHFYRLLGDVAGDGVVDQNDLNEIAASIGETSQLGWAPLSASVTGDATVSSLDLLLATRSKNRKLASGLSLG